MEGPWLTALDRALLRRLVSRRTLDGALASRLGYLRPPVLLDGGHFVVRAVLGDAELDYRVVVRIADGNSTLTGECSRCSQTFGPCVHVAILAVDLACSAELRRALLAGEGTAAIVARAPELRFAVDAEVRFDGALAAWIAPTADGTPVEIAASPFAEVDPHVGRGYGDRVDRGETRILSVVVRRAGERKLLGPREIVPPSDFGARDRRVLEHTRDRGSGKKTVHAIGVEASLAIEAMRLHGGVFAEGFKGRLDFRAAMVRPSIALVPAGAGGSPFDALAASWLAEDGATPIPFATSAFFPGPFPFVWTPTGAIYRVARDVDLDLAAQLARSSVILVPPGRLRDAGSRLLRAARGRGVAMPAHEIFGLPPTETPDFVLRLWGEPLAVVGELVAVYPAREVLLYPVDGVGSEDGRDLDEEARARAHVEAAGVVRGRSGDEDGEAEDDASAEVGVSDEDAVAFWQHGLTALRSATSPSIDVRLSENLARVRVGPPLTGRVHVALEGNWLDTRLEFAAGELTVELGAVRAALAGKRRWVALSDGTLSRITSSLEALVDEAAEVMPGEVARLPAHQLGRLDRWIEENDGRMDVAVEGLRRRLRTNPGILGTVRGFETRFERPIATDRGSPLAGRLRAVMRPFLLRRKEAEGPAPSLVVCPTSVATNWVREAARFTPGLRVTLHHGPSRERSAAPLADSDVVVTTYALLRRDVEALAAIRFRCVVLDEAQNIKNADAATTRAAGRPTPASSGRCGASRRGSSDPSPPTAGARSRGGSAP
ncbi:MAG: SNF2-related protein [Polyangiaceae bacterium]